MDRIRQLYQSLSKSEKRYLHNYLSAFHSKGANKALELIEELEKHPDLTQAEMSEKLYGDPRSKAFIMLKGRLLDKMLETLSLGVNFQNNPAFKEDTAAFATIELQKSLIYALLLRRRGLDEFAAELLEKVERQANELALPEFRLQALTYLRNVSASQKQVVFGYRSEIEEALNQYKTDLIGAGIFDEFRVLQAEKVSSKDQPLAFLEENIQVLENRLTQAYSPRSHYYCLSMKIFLHDLRGEIKEAGEVLQDLVALLREQPALANKNRLGASFIQLAAIDLRRFDYQAAIRSADQALNVLHPRKRNFLSASIYKLYALILSGELDMAEEMISGLSRFTGQKRLDATTEIVSYLHACLKYLQGNSRQALQQLQTMHELHNDKKGWNVGLRIFEIMLLIDLDMPDLASARIESLRKHIARYSGSIRSELVYQYFHQLEKHSFDWRVFTPEMEDLDQKLALATWTPVGQELINFEFWLKSHRHQAPLAQLLKATQVTEKVS